MQLDFEAATHTYRFGGKVLPSVSEILKPIVDFSMVDPDVLEAAREFGQHVHLATHLFDTEQLEWSTLDPALVPYVEAWKQFIEDSGAVVIASEQPIVHQELGYAGMPDRVLSWKDRIVVPDLKATSVVPRSVGPQTAGYAKAYQSMHGVKKEPERLCIHLKPGKYTVHRRRELSDWSMFLSCLNVWKWNHAT